MSPVNPRRRGAAGRIRLTVAASLVVGVAVAAAPASADDVRRDVRRDDAVAARPDPIDDGSSDRLGGGDLTGLDLRSTIERTPTGSSHGETLVLELLTTGADELATGRAAVEASGGRVIDTTPSGVILVEVPTSAADALADATAGSGGLTVRAPLELDVRPERHSPVADPLRTTTPSPESAGAHGAVTGVDRWHDAGHTGEGIRVGVIDFFNVPAFWDTEEMGPQPVAGVTARCFDRGNDCTSEFYAPNPLPGDDHGPAVVEIVKDMAPDAQIFIGRAVTESDYYRLVDWFADNGVHIVNRSLGSRYDGPGDGRGALTAVADYAVGQGITWVNSGGNNGRDRYYRQPVRMVGDLVAFGPSGTETSLPFTGCIAPGGVRWAGDWDLPAAQRTDYDVFIDLAPVGNPAAGSVFASSTFRQQDGAPPLEVFGGGSACPPAGQQFFMRIQLVAGNPDGDVIEILDYADGIARYTQAPFSASTPVVDSRSAGVLAVGAVDPPASGQVGAYSSQGPTNDGRVKPDLVAPSGSASVTFGGTFSGTSAAAPVVAGGAAVLLSAGLAADAPSLGDLVRHLVVDGGQAGRDNVYGTGEFRLPAPPGPAGDARPSRYVPLDAPTRILDTRPDAAIGPAALIGDRWPGRIVDLSVSNVPGADPAEVTAVAANVTVVGASRPGYTQAFPTLRATLSGFSNSNIDTDAQTRPNFMIIPVGADGEFSIYLTSGGDLLVDVLGTFEAADEAVAAGRFVRLPDARRVLDTRAAPGTPVATGQQVTVGVPGGLPDGLGADDVDALVVTVTATQTAGIGYVQAFPAGRVEEVGRTSTLNLTDGATAANTVIVPVTDAGFALYADLGPGGTAHLIADVTGVVTAASAAESERGRFVAVRPGRAFDSRSTGSPIASGATVDVQSSSAPGAAVPSDASAVVWNLTATGTTLPGFLSGWPASAAEPPTSSLNWTVPQSTIANAGIIATDAAGVMRVRVDAGPQLAGAPLTHAIVDVFGYFT